MPALRKVAHYVRSFQQTIPPEAVFIEGAKQVGGRSRFRAQENLPSDNVAQDHGKHCHGAEGEFAQPQLFRRHSLARF